MWLVKLWWGHIGIGLAFNPTWLVSLWEEEQRHRYPYWCGVRAWIYAAVSRGTLELGENQGQICSLSSEEWIDLTDTLILDFCPSELWEDIILLCYAIRDVYFVTVSTRKLISLPRARVQASCFHWDSLMWCLPSPTSQEYEVIYTYLFNKYQTPTMVLALSWVLGRDSWTGVWSSALIYVHHAVTFVISVTYCRLYAGFLTL